MFKKCRVGSIAYYVNDIDRTEVFYRDTLGLELERIPDEHGDFLMANTANDVALVFFQQESRPGNTPVIVFEIADGGIDDMVAALSEKGVTIVTPVSHAPGGWTADIADPDNHHISLYQPEDLPRSLTA